MIQLEERGYHNALKNHTIRSKLKKRGMLTSRRIEFMLIFSKSITRDLQLGSDLTMALFLIFVRQ